MYVDDIIFESTNAEMIKEIANVMAKMFEMSMMGELNVRPKIFLNK